LEENETFSTLKILICTKYFLQKLTHFSQGNNVLDAFASITNGFLSRDIFGKQLYCTGLCGTKRAYLHLGKPT
jgi:hypothetical protein